MSGELVRQRRRAMAIALALVWMTALVIVGPQDRASAAECTTTWIGPPEGLWQESESWSTSAVPTSSDVVCIPSAKSVEVDSGSRIAALLQGEGELVISGGSLDLVGESGESNIGSWELSGGALGGGQKLHVTKFFNGVDGTIDASATVVLGLTATAEISGSGAESGKAVRLLDFAELVINGHLALKGAAPRLIARDVAGIRNEGTLSIPGKEGEILIQEGGTLENHEALGLSGEEAKLTASEKGEIFNLGLLQASGSGEIFRLAKAGRFENFGEANFEGADIDLQMEEGGKLVNEAAGSLLLTNSASRIWTATNGRVENFGTLLANGEGEGHGLRAGGSPSESLFLNKGTFQKASGTGTTVIDIRTQNEGLVEAKSGYLSFSGGGNSGQEAADSWVAAASEGVGIVFTGAAFSLGSEAKFSGGIQIGTGASVSAGAIKGPAAMVGVAGGSLALQSEAGNTTLQLLTTSEGGEVKGSGGLSVESVLQEEGSIAMGPGTVTSIDSFEDDAESTITFGPSATVEIASGFYYGDVQLGAKDVGIFGYYGAEGSTTIVGPESQLQFEEGEFWPEGALEVGANSTVDSEYLYLSDGSKASFGANSVLTGLGWWAYHGSVLEIGEDGSLSGGELFVDESQLTVHSRGAITMTEYIWINSNGSLTTGEDVTLTGQESFWMSGNFYERVSGSLGEGTTISSPESYWTYPETTAAADVQIELGEMYFTAGELGLEGNSQLKVDELYLSSGTIRGSGDVTANYFYWGWGEMAGSGTTTIIEEGYGPHHEGRNWTNMEWEPALVKLNERTLISEGSFEHDRGTMQLENGAEFRNNGTFEASSEASAYGAAIQVGSSSVSPPRFVNRGTFNKTEGFGTTRVVPTFRNDGKVEALTGFFEFVNPIGIPASERFGKHCLCGDPIDNATGEYLESEADLQIPGLGPDLEITRSYSSGAAAEAGAPGPFGYGWTTSYTQHLLIGEGGNEITLVASDGATTPFARVEAGSYSAPSWSQAELLKTEGGYRVKNPDGMEEGFSVAGKLIEIADRFGNALSLSYDEAGRLVTAEDAVGRQLNFTYNEAGLVKSVEDPAGHKFAYGYENGDLISVTHPAATAPRWQMTYDGQHRMLTRENGLGGEIVNEYDEAGRVVKQTDLAGLVLTFEYGGFHTVVTNETTWAVTDLWFNSNNQPTMIKRAAGSLEEATERFTYDEAGRVVEESTGEGRITTYEYNSAGDMVEEIDGEGNETTWTYNARHDITSETNPEEETTTFSRDANGLIEFISQPAPGGKTRLMSYDYDGLGQLQEVTDPMGEVWSFGYDAYGNRTSEESPEGEEATRTYNVNSQLVTEISPRGNLPEAESGQFETTFGYGPDGRLQSITYPDEGESTFAYDVDGNLVETTDPAGRTTTMGYDEADRNVTIVRADSSILTSEYDAEGHLVSQENAAGQGPEYDYGQTGLLTSVTDSNGNLTRLRYDGSGNLIEELDPMERTTTYAYDLANRRTGVRYWSEEGLNATFDYDKAGRLTAMTDATGESSFAYDQLGRLVEATQEGQTVAYGYDLGGHVTSIGYPGFGSLSKAYDKTGRLSGVTDWNSRETTFGYNADSHLIGIEYPGSTGGKDTFSVDWSGRLEAVDMKKGGSSLATIEYQRDSLGNPTEEHQSGLPGAKSQEFSYNKLNQVASPDPGPSPTTAATTRPPSTESVDSNMA